MKTEAIIGLKCIGCASVVSAEPFHYTCPKCGKNLDYIYDYEHIKSSWSKADLKLNPDPSIWRYLPLLPVKQSPENTSLKIGGTPLVNFPGIAQDHGLASLQIKDDSRNPSGSLKDRASELAVRHARELGQDTIVAASTGNAGSSVAALSAHHGLKSIIFTPESAPEGKLTQIRQHGAKLVPVKGNYDTAFDLAFEWSTKQGQYCRNSGVNPILSEGKKTVALEIAEQRNWQVPDHVFVPVGDGCIISGVYKGFYDLHALGWIDRLPRIHAVQAVGASAIVNSLAGDGEIVGVDADTIADGISVDLPRDGDKARRAIIESNGLGFKVSDEDILSAQKKLSQTAGLFVEPAAAAAYAGFLQASSQKIFDPEDQVVIITTGFGLKDIKSAQTLLESADPVEANMNAIESYIKAR